MPRKKERALKRYERLPRHKLGRLGKPVSLEEAKARLGDVADHLSCYPNAGPSLRFHALAIKNFLKAKGKVSFLVALGLKPQPTATRGRPATSSLKVREVVRLLHEKRSISTIIKATRLSKDTIETIRAEVGKVTHAVPDTLRDDDGDVRPPEWADPLQRASRVTPAMRKAILSGLADTVNADDLLPKSSPSRPSAPRHVAAARPPRPRRKNPK